MKENTRNSLEGARRVNCRKNFGKRNTGVKNSCRDT